MTEPFWTWLHGPTHQPDPRVGDTSASAAHRATLGGYIWDHWMNEPLRDLQPREETGAA